MTFVFYPISLYYGSCIIESIILASTIWTQFGVNTNIAAISVGIYVTLKYNDSSHRLTYKKVCIVLAVVWLYPVLWAVTLSVTIKNIRSLRCYLYADDYNVPVNDDDFTITSGTPYQIILYILRDLLLDIPSHALIIIFCVASYRLFRKSTINPSEEITRKMLLLPILTTILSTVVNTLSGMLLIAVNEGYAALSQSLQDYERSPLYYVQPILQFLVEYTAIAYAGLLIYLNKKLQATYKATMKSLFRCKCKKHNRVAPQ